MFVTDPDVTKSPIKQEKVADSKKTLGIHDSPAGSNADHLVYIKVKVHVWIHRMQNGHLPGHIAWTAYKHQLWPGLRNGLGTMTNNLEPADELLHAEDYKLLNVLGVLWNITKGLRRLHTTFGSFGLFSLPTEQLIGQVNILMQHDHASTNLGRKLNALLRYLQLQLGTPHNPFTLEYHKWGHTAQLSWVKMCWRLLQHFDIHLDMAFPSIPLPWGRDQVIMEIFHTKGLGPETIRGLGRCREALKAIFLSDITTADGRYLENFVFNPGDTPMGSTFKFPWESPTKGDWNLWFNFWHHFTSTGDKLKVPLGTWTHKSHCI
jgi:hypothetical protein